VRSSVTALLFEYYSLHAKDNAKDVVSGSHLFFPSGPSPTQIKSDKRRTNDTRGIKSTNKSTIDVMSSSRFHGGRPVGCRQALAKNGHRGRRTLL
jgi:hypothetical protein